VQVFVMQGARLRLEKKAVEELPVVVAKIRKRGLR
jgi:hypothetical protein